MGAASWVGPAIVAAFISAVVTGFGWYVSERQASRREDRLRRERVADMQTALLADIRAAGHRIGDVQTSTAAALRTMQADPSFLPFVPRQPTSFILTATLNDLQALPTEVIDPVVLYYRQMAMVDFLIDDLRSDRFAALDATRRLSVYEDYTALLVYAAALGRTAAETLQTSLSTKLSARSVP